MKTGTKIVSVLDSRLRGNDSILLNQVIKVCSSPINRKTRNLLTTVTAQALPEELLNLTNNFTQERAARFDGIIKMTSSFA